MLDVVEKGKEIMVRLFVKDAAAYVPCAVSTLNNLRSTGGGPIYIKRGSRVLYDTRDLDKWVEADKRKSTSDPGPGPSPGHA
jgi:hypothetical protein